MIAPKLSPRELMSLEALADGLTYAQIATRLHVAESTAKTYIVHVYRALGVGNSAQAVAVGIRLGLLDAGLVDTLRGSIAQARLLLDGYDSAAPDAYATVVKAREFLAGVL